MDRMMITEAVNKRVSSGIRYVKPVRESSVTGSTDGTGNRLSPRNSFTMRFRLHYPDDSQLITATAWASFAAARRVGVWFKNEIKEVNGK